MTHTHTPTVKSRLVDNVIELPEMLLSLYTYFNIKKAVDMTGFTVGTTAPVFIFHSPMTVYGSSDPSTCFETAY